ncbi:MAG: hypothetical protein KDC34_15855 [Saprospiraceae bacterium]|nr:hypothetical protein [Saprospiraceae bacterium]
MVILILFSVGLIFLLFFSLGSQPAGFGEQFEVKRRDQKINQLYKKQNEFLKESLDDSRAAVRNLSKKIQHLESRQDLAKRDHASEIQKVKQEYSLKKLKSRNIRAFISIAVTVALGLLTGDGQLVGIVGLVTLFASFFVGGSEYGE